MCVEGRAWLSPICTPNFIWGHSCSYLCLFRSKVAGKSVAIIDGQGKQKILVDTPRKHELHMTSTWLHLEPICSQINHQSGLVGCTNSLNPGNSQKARPTWVLSLALSLLPLPWAHAHSVSEWAVRPMAPSPVQPHPSGLRAFLSCVFEQFRKDEAFPTVAARAQ